MVAEVKFDQRNARRGPASKPFLSRPSSKVWRLLVDDRAARCVDQPRRRFHERQLGGADETAGTLAQDEMESSDATRHTTGKLPSGSGSERKTSRRRAMASRQVA